MPSFTVDATTARRLREVTASRGISQTELIRYALREFEQLPSQGQAVELSVRLDPSETKKLATMAKRAKVSRSRMLASLVERALDQLVIEQSAQAKPSTRRASTERHPEPASIPGPKAYKTWAGLILDSAEFVERRAPGDRKAWISSVIDSVIKRTRPEDPDQLERQIRALLPELNRRDLLALHRCDLPSLFPKELVQASELTNSLATWHFIELPK
jgi:predicted transcriptional regulator